MSIWDRVKQEPGRWFRAADFDSEEDQWDVAETGGMIQWCMVCDTHCSPNRPCFCGLWVIQRQDDGRYFYDPERADVDWGEDWKYDAHHMFGMEEALQVARALADAVGPVVVRKIGSPKETWNVAPQGRLSNPVIKPHQLGQ